MTISAPAVVGIDVSKAKLDVVFLSDEQENHTQFKNTPAGFKKLHAWLQSQLTSPAKICLEATGIYGQAVALYLYEQDYPVSIINPAQIKAYGQSRLRRTKTDKNDALLIADYARRHELPSWRPPTPEQETLQAIVRYLNELQAQLQAERNRLKTTTNPTVQTSIQTHIHFLEAEQVRLQQELDDLLDQHPDLKQNHALLKSIPGIGDWTAFVLLAEIPDIRQFSSVKELVAYAGLNPEHRQSGTSSSARTPISKIGNARLRKALFMPAIVAKQHNPVVRAFYERLLANGKLKMVVIVACMQKLLHLVYGILKSQTPFDPNFLGTRS